MWLFHKWPNVNYQWHEDVNIVAVSLNADERDCVFIFSHAVTCATEPAQRHGISNEQVSFLSF